MPVRTRAQLRKSKTSESPQPIQPIEPITTRRRSVRIARKNTEEQEQNEQKEGSSTPILSQSTDAGPTSEQIDTEKLRQRVRTILETPVKSNEKRRTFIPTPGADKINIRNGNDDEQFSFFIPPSNHYDPIEMRQQIRRSLGDDTSKPQLPVRTEPLVPRQDNTIQNNEKLKSLSPKLDQKTGLYSPVTPNYNKEKAEQVSKWLIFLIFSILIAIFAGYYQSEIVQFLQQQIKPMGQIWESLSSSISSFITSMISSFVMNGNNENEINDVDNGDNSGNDDEGNVITPNN